MEGMMNMARKKGFGVSPITNTIYYGIQDTDKNMWVGEKKDVTNEVVATVFEWFMGNMDGNAEYSIHYKGYDYELVMRKRSDENG